MVVIWTPSLPFPTRSFNVSGDVFDPRTVTATVKSSASIRYSGPASMSMLWFVHIRKPPNSSANATTSKCRVDPAGIRTSFSAGSSSRAQGLRSAACSVCAQRACTCGQALPGAAFEVEPALHVLGGHGRGMVVRDWNLDKLGDERLTPMPTGPLALRRADLLDNGRVELEARPRSRPRQLAEGREPGRGGLLGHQPVGEHDGKRKRDGDQSAQRSSCPRPPVRRPSPTGQTTLPEGARASARG